MLKSKIKEKLSRNEPALGVQLHLTDPATFELVGLMGFDGIWMDLEHHGYSVETAGNLMRAARVGGTDIVARPGKGEFMRMGRLLELGAQVIMYPRCDDVKEAAEVVRWSRYAPLGNRGFDGSGVDNGYLMLPIPEYIAHANRETLLCIQVEEQHAVDQAEAILATPGVDLIMLGPADFSILSGFPGQFDHPKVTAALEKVAAAARNTGKHWACTVPNVERAQQMVEMGSRLVFHGADVVMVKLGLEAMQSQFGAAGFKFDNQLQKSAQSYLQSK
jgi:4-hydroxy-2-oxoheptanedioate aldolase